MDNSDPFAWISALSPDDRRQVPLELLHYLTIASRAVDEGSEKEIERLRAVNELMHHGLGLFMAGVDTAAIVANMAHEAKLRNIGAAFAYCVKSVRLLHCPRD